MNCHLTCTKCGKYFKKSREEWKEHTRKCKGRASGVLKSPKPVEQIKNIEPGFKRGEPKKPKYVEPKEEIKPQEEQKEPLKKRGRPKAPKKIESKEE